MSGFFSKYTFMLILSIIYRYLFFLIIMLIFIDSETKHSVYKLLTFRHIYYLFLLSNMHSKHQSIPIVEYKKGVKTIYGICIVLENIRRIY